MTIWTSLDWSEMESIEHRNKDIIMEDLWNMLTDNCMEVDVEEAWGEMEMMEGVDCNTHSSPRLEQGPPKIAENTANQSLKTDRWMVWSEVGVEIAKEYAKKFKDEDKVDLGSDDLPDLHGEHVGRELHVGSVGRDCHDK